MFRSIGARGGESLLAVIAKGHNGREMRVAFEVERHSDTNIEITTSKYVNGKGIQVND
jgi:hypothetical protein